MTTQPTIRFAAIGLNHGHIYSMCEAVVRGADFVGDEPFMLLLGDHVYKPAAKRPAPRKAPPAK